MYFLQTRRCKFGIDKKEELGLQLIIGQGSQKMKNNKRNKSSTTIIVYGPLPAPILNNSLIFHKRFVNTPNIFYNILMP